MRRAEGRSSWADDAKASAIRVGRQLVREGNPEYAPMLEAMQKSDDEEVALSALYALQNIGDERAFSTIMDLYERSNSEELRGRIVYILGNFDAPSVVERLSQIAMNDASFSETPSMPSVRATTKPRALP